MDGHAVNTQPQRITKDASFETKGHVLLQTTTALATNREGSKSTKVKILFDCGSQPSYVTDSLKSRNPQGLKTSTSTHLEKGTFEKKMRCCNFAS